MGALFVFLILLFVAVTCLSNLACKREWVGLFVGPLAGTVFAFLAINLMYVADGRREKFIAIALFFGTIYASVASAIVSSMTYIVRLFLERRRQRRGVNCIRCGYFLFGNQSGKCPECGQPIDAVQMAAAKLGVKLNRE